VPKTNRAQLSETGAGKPGSEPAARGRDDGPGSIPHRSSVRARRPALGRLAAALITASVATGLLTIFARVFHAGVDLGNLEGVTLFLAASAYLAYALAHHRNRRELVTRSILVSAFAIWGIVQLAPGFAGTALLNDITILLFVTDLAVLLSPWT
jgi:hypothetical protein